MKGLARFWFREGQEVFNNIGRLAVAIAGIGIAVIYDVRFQLCALFILTLAACHSDPIPDSDSTDSKVVDGPADVATESPPSNDKRRPCFFPFRAHGACEYVTANNRM